MVNQFCNKLFCINGIEGMQSLPDNSVPLTVTSPPYDQIRTYGGHKFDFPAMANEMWRVTAEGGIVCWIVQEQIVNGSETGTSSKQRLYFRNLGFRLHHTMVHKSLRGTLNNQYRYGDALEYIFVLSKGKPRTFRPIRDIPNKRSGELAQGYCKRDADGRKQSTRATRIRQNRVRGPIWAYVSGLHATEGKIARQHPSPMNWRLARDLIRSFSRPGELVLDPMSGAGTTAYSAMFEGRCFLGFEIHEPYHQIAEVRLKAAFKTLSIPNDLHVVTA